MSLFPAIGKPGVDVVEQLFAWKQEEQDTSFVLKHCPIGVYFGMALRGFQDLS
jgi:hypothetical protein